MKYDFKVLSYIEFEELARDILSKYLNTSFRTYGIGRDLGIDLSAENRTKIVQVKHYANSTFSDLQIGMKKEFIKMEKFEFDIYILVTSLSLTPNNINKLIGDSQGKIKSEDNIYDLNRLNDILLSAEFKDIEKKHYKLWISSTEVMERILHNGIINQIEEKIIKIKEQLPKYVITDSFHKAYKELKENRVILIHGEPGIGKSTLADLLVFKFMDKEYKLKSMTGNDLNSLLNIVETHTEEKEVILLDDFLGSNILADLSSVESKLDNFISSIMRKKNKYLIMTTRSTILNKSVNQYEKINSIVRKINGFLLEVKDYTPYEKAKIFYNHIGFNELDELYKEQIKTNKNYLKIVNHRNYNPRIIEFITDKYLIKNEVKEDNYLEFVNQNLNNPKEIWKKEFENRLVEIEKIILLTLLSFNSEIKYSVLEKAFEIRYQNEIEKNNFKREIKCFEKALETLSKSFLKIKNSVHIELIVDFINPSVRDFLIEYIKNNKIENKRIIENIVYLEQFNIYTRKNEIMFEIKDTGKSIFEYMEKKILSDYEKLEKCTLIITKEKHIIEILECFESKEIEELKLQIVKDIYTKKRYKNNREYREIINKFLNSKKRNLASDYLESQNIQNNTNYLENQTNEKEFFEVAKYINEKYENGIEEFKENNFYSISKILKDVYKESCEYYIDGRYFNTLEDYYGCIKDEKLDIIELKFIIHEQIEEELSNILLEANRYFKLSNEEKLDLKKEFKEILEVTVEKNIIDVVNHILDNHKANQYDDDDYDRYKDDEMDREPEMTIDDMFDKL